MAVKTLRVLGEERVGKKTLIGSLIYKCGLELPQLEKLERNGIRDLDAIVPFYEKAGITPCFYAPSGQLVVEKTATPDILLWVVDATDADKGSVSSQKLAAALSDGTVQPREKLLILVNKMDLINWSESTFREIVHTFNAVGAIPEKTYVIPISGLQGDNILGSPEQPSWALVYAHEDDSNYGAFLRSVIGVTFLGTPHRGSDVANLGSIVGSIINISVMTASAGMRPGIIRTDLLDGLNHDSPALQDLILSAKHRLKNIAVVTFYETEPMLPRSSLVVDFKSSILGIDNEDVNPLFADHRDICRFSGETQNYKAVSRAIRRIALRSQIEREPLKRASTRSSDRTLGEIEKSCMALFSVFDVADYRRMLPKPVKAACQWVLNHPVFVSWLKKAENALLWLMGPPGCGKTMLSLSLVQDFEDGSVPQVPRDVLIYFCDNKINKQKDGKAILIGLIFQMVRRHRSMVRHVRKAFEIRGSSMIRSFSALWDIFLEIVKDPKSGTFYIILDALDECEEVTCRQLLESIYTSVSAPVDSGGIGGRVKFLMTSRPLRGQSYFENNAAVVEQKIFIHNNQPGYNEGLQTFIQQRINDISVKRNCPDEVKEFLLQVLYSKADQTFLWIHMVLASLESSLLASVKEFRDIIARTPPDLETIYLDFLNAIPPDHRDTALHLLRLILASSRPLSLDEINISFTINASHIDTEDVLRDRQIDMAHTLQGILGPLVRVSESKVSLVHLSAKDFLLRTDHVQDGAFPAMRAINAEDCALQMASACVRYLMLEDLSQDLFTGEDSSNQSSSGPSSPSGASSPVGSFTGGFFDEEGLDLGADRLFREPGVPDTQTSQLLASKHGFFSYASLHWTEHFALCEASAPVELREAAKTLLDVSSGACRNWLYFYHADAATAMDGDPTSFDSVTLAAYFNLHETLVDLLGSQESSQATKNQALFWASRNGHSRIVTELLGAGADPAIQGPELQTPLTAAAEQGHLSCVAALLVDSRTDVNMRGRGGGSALSFACANGHEDIVRSLLSRKDCEANAPDSSGATPLFRASGGGNMSIISRLAKHPGVDINHRDKKGRTAVSWVAGDGMEEVLKRLLKLRGIDANLKDNTGRSPLSWAAGNGCAATVEVLLENKKVDKKTLDRDNRNPISWASAGGHANALRMLLKHGCPGIQDEDVDGWTPLAWAIQTDSPGVVEALLSTEKIELEGRDRDGRTALFWAVVYGHAPVVKVLLREGADPETETYSGKTAVSVAESAGRNDLLNELLFYVNRKKIKIG
ncbi:uncharacterized protein DNG_05209 [Cephalotrichum gorgonifer]|uniref:NACHT domain-containing protein n=1 Tax=Cephalotrichum gorgonifer TaxID=2041049 RepID=A0AAE8SVA5_9PEZI|nr:uncharacterized protein DNG_05209 [Cephalotrichum gorgonifer]